MRVLGLSTVTNVARPDAPQIVSAEEVVHVAATALPKVRRCHGILAAKVARRLMVTRDSVAAGRCNALLNPTC